MEKASSLLPRGWIINKETASMTKEELIELLRKEIGVRNDLTRAWNQLIEKFRFLDLSEKDAENYSDKWDILCWTTEQTLLIHGPKARLCKWEKRFIREQVRQDKISVKNWLNKYSLSSSTLKRVLTERDLGDEREPTYFHQIGWRKKYDDDRLKEKVLYVASRFQIPIT